MQSRQQLSPDTLPVPVNQATAPGQQAGSAGSSPEKAPSVVERADLIKPTDVSEQSHGAEIDFPQPCAGFHLFSLKTAP